VRIADAQREAGAVHSLGSSVITPKKFLPSFVTAYFLGRDRDVPEPELFFEGLHDVDVRNDLVGRGGLRGFYKRELRPREFAGRVGTGDERRFGHRFSFFVFFGCVDADFLGPGMAQGGAAGTTAKLTG